MPNVYRTTYWSNARHDIVQVAVCIMDEDWEPLAEATQQVGPFDDAMEAVREALRQARALSDRQMRGQMSLLAEAAPHAPGMPGSPGTPSSGPA